MMPIGYFQFVNLIQSRVSFVLFSQNYDFAGWFLSVEQRHLEGILRPVENLDLETLNPFLPPGLEEPIVLVCTDGSTAPRAAKELEAKGYLNVYYVLGGWRALLEERGS